MTQGAVREATVELRDGIWLRRGTIGFVLGVPARVQAIGDGVVTVQLEDGGAAELPLGTIDQWCGL